MPDEIKPQEKPKHPTASRIRYIRDQSEPTWKDLTKEMTKSGLEPKTPGFRKFRKLEMKKRLDIQQAGEIDFLTEVLNRRGFLRRLTEEISRSRRLEKIKEEIQEEKIEEKIEKKIETGLILLFIDLNELRSLNKEVSTTAGDQLLKATAKILTTDPEGHVRPTDVVGRWGGDEFLVILPQTSIEGAKKYWEMKNNQFKNYKDEEHKIKSIWVSSGAVRIEPKDLKLKDLKQEDIEKIIEKIYIGPADRAMQQAKTEAKKYPENRQNLLQIASDTSTIA